MSNSGAQEALVLLWREKLLIGLDDLLAVVREFIEPSMSRSALDRMLRRHGAPSLTALAKAETEANKAADKKSFKSYPPGFIHMDIKYLPKLEGEASRRYLFVAIDRATRWVFHGIYDDQTEVSSTDFLRRLMVERFNGRISEVLHSHHFDSSQSFEMPMERYIWFYNHHLPQRALNHISPVDALKSWQKESPELFNKPVRKFTDQPGLDN